MTVLEYAVAQLAGQLGLTLPDARDLTVRFIEYTRRLAARGCFDYAREPEEVMHETTLAVWKYVARYTDKQQFPPTTREIALACGIKSLNTVHYHLKALAKEGVILHTANIARGIQVLKQPEQEAV